MLWFIVLLAGLVIVASLAVYAGMLLFKLRQQHNQLEQNGLLKSTSLIDSIRIIALGVKQGQCELSEAAIRIVKLLEALPEHTVDYPKQFPSLHLLFEKIKHMPTHEQRKQQGKFERKKMDSERLKYEQELQPKILSEIEDLINFPMSGNEV